MSYLRPSKYSPETIYQCRLKYSTHTASSQITFDSNPFVEKVLIIRKDFFSLDMALNSDIIKLLSNVIVDLYLFPATIWKKGIPILNSMWLDFLPVFVMNFQTPSHVSIVLITPFASIEDWIVLLRAKPLTPIFFRNTP